MKKMSFKMLFQSIDEFGYHYSFIQFMKSFFIFSLLCVTIAYLHYLKWYYIGLLLVILLCSLPFVIYSQYKFMYEQKRFHDLCIYLKNIVLHFKNTKMIIRSLELTKEQFSKDSEMYKCIESAIEVMNCDRDYKKGFEKIEERFFNSYVRKIHSYMVLGQEEGGDNVFTALDTVDFRRWKNDTYAFQTRKHKSKNYNAIFSVVSLGISAYLIQFYPMELKADMITSNTYQILTFIYCAIILLTFIYVKSFLTDKWIKKEE